MPSRGRKRRGALGAWLWCLFALNTVIGLLVSPITGAYKVRVSGAEPGQRVFIERNLQSLRSEPILRLNFDRFFSQILSNNQIQSARYRQNLFGRGDLRIVNKKPVAWVYQARRIALSSTGSLFVAASNGQKLIQIFPYETAFRPSLTLIGNWEGRDLAKISEGFSNISAIDGGSLVQDPSGKVSFKVDGGPTIVLGATENLDAKLEAVNKALAAQPDLLKKVKVLNVSAPKSPVIVPFSQPVPRQ